MTGAAPPTAFAAQWSIIPGIQSHLLASNVSRRFPLFVGLIACRSLLSGGFPGLVSCTLVGVLGVVIQKAAAFIGSLIVMPANRQTLDTLLWLRDNSWIKKLVPQLGSGLEGPIGMLTSMRENLESSRGRLVNGSGGERLALGTPDGGQFDAMIFGRAELLRRRPASEAAAWRWDNSMRGVLVYLGGNGEHYEFRSDLPSFAQSDLGLALLLLNYRGVGASPGNITRDGAVVDVASALAYLTSDAAAGGLGVPRNRIILVGHSIGGGFGTEAAQFFPGILTINDRSFGKLSTTAMFHLAKPLCEGHLYDSAAGWCVRYAIHWLLNHIACWELDSLKHWLKLQPSTKAIVYSHQDAVIPPQAQLLPALSAAGARQSEIGCVMMMDYTSPGGDAHNRGWSRSELGRVRELVDRFLRGHPLGDTV